MNRQRQKERRYVEAHPVVDAAAALRNWRAGRAGILWRDRKRFMVGAAVVDWPGPGRLNIRYVIHDTDCLDGSADTIVFATQEIGPLQNKNRVHIICNRCGAGARIIIYGQLSWECRLCQGLVNRSSLISQKIRISEKISFLLREVGQGRPLHMRERAYREKLAELSSLRAKVGGKLLTAPIEYMDRVTTEWVPASPEFDGLFQRAINLRLR